MLELTEHSAVKDWTAAQRNVAALQTAGVLIALDDFRTGTSNLRSMNEFDVDDVKLDRSFITGPLTPRRRSLVTSVVDLTHERRAQLIAEGVETSESSRMVADLGVDFIAGIHSRTTRIHRDPPRRLTVELPVPAQSPGQPRWRITGDTFSP